MNVATGYIVYTHTHYKLHIFTITRSRAVRLIIKTNRNLNSVTQAISFLNENDSPKSIKPLKSMITEIQNCIGAATDPERAVVKHKYETASQTFCLTSIQIITEVLE